MDVINQNSMYNYIYKLVLSLLLVLGLSGDASGMCGEYKQHLESHIRSSEGLCRRRENSGVWSI